MVIAVKPHPSRVLTNRENTDIKRGEENI